MGVGLTGSDCEQGGEDVPMEEVGFGDVESAEGGNGI